MAAALVALLSIALAGSVIGPAAAQTLHQVLASPLVEEGSGPDGCTPGGERARRTGSVGSPRRTAPARRQGAGGDEPRGGAQSLSALHRRPSGGEERRGRAFIRGARRPHRARRGDCFALRRSAGLLCRRGRCARRQRALAAHRQRRAPPDCRPRHGVWGRAKSRRSRIKAVDTSFSVSLDGKLLFETHDDGIATPGRFGIWSRADSLTSFGDLFITILD